MCSLEAGRVAGRGSPVSKHQLLVGECGEGRDWISLRPPSRNLCSTLHAAQPLVINFRCFHLSLIFTERLALEIDEASGGRGGVLTTSGAPRRVLWRLRPGWRRVSCCLDTH